MYVSHHGAINAELDISMCVAVLHMPPLSPFHTFTPMPNPLIPTDLPSAVFAPHFQVSTGLDGQRGDPGVQVQDTSARCNGVQVVWLHGNTFCTYPFTIHSGESLGFLVCGILNSGAVVCVQSDACLGERAQEGSKVCIPCVNIPSRKN